MPNSNTTFLATCRRKKTPYTPVWVMRQAGRYMKEYRELRARVAFLDLCKTPELAAEVTLMPVNRLGVDAAILFSDILLLLEPMGVGLEYAKNDGPLIHRPIRTPKDVENLIEVDSLQSLPFVFESIRKVVAALDGRVPLVGFAGAPFTLAAYLIEGGASRDYLRTKRFLFADAEAWHALMDHLCRALVQYLNEQIAAGVGAVQLFDSWVGCMAPEEYRRYVLPHMKKLIAALTPGVPVIHFGTGTCGLLEIMREAGGDVLGLDWRVNLDEAWGRIGYDVGVQGNLDPALLFSSPTEIRSRVGEILKRAGGRPGHIFNLGHGVHPETPVEHVIAMVEAVHELSLR